MLWGLNLFLSFFFQFFYPLSSFFSTHSFCILPIFSLFLFSHIFPILSFFFLLSLYSSRALFLYPFFLYSSHFLVSLILSIFFPFFLYSSHFLFFLILSILFPFFLYSSHSLLFLIILFNLPFLKYKKNIYMPQEKNTFLSLCENKVTAINCAV